MRNRRSDAYRFVLLNVEGDWSQGHMQTCIAPWCRCMPANLGLLQDSLMDMHAYTNVFACRCFWSLHETNKLAGIKCQKVAELGRDDTIPGW
jgi:hypothetical protein